MILNSAQVRASRQRGVREIRYGYDDPNLPDLGPGETVAAETDNGRILFWLEVGCNGKCNGRCENLGSYADDKTREIVYEYRRVPAPDTPRLLTPAGRPRGSELGYTDKPYLSMIDEPEAVDSQTQEEFAKQASQRDEQRKTKRDVAARRTRELLSIEERMLQARATARLNSISVHAEMKALTRMQRRGQSQGLAQELERVERIVYREAA